MRSSDNSIEHSTARLATLIKYIYIYMCGGWMLGERQAGRLIYTRICHHVPDCSAENIDGFFFFFTHDSIIRYTTQLPGFRFTHFVRC